MRLQQRSKTRSKTQKRKQGGADKTPRHCQCDPRCPNPPLQKEPFCAYHAKHGCPRKNPLTGWEPDYNPNEYNQNKAIQHSHNCYAYAMNVKDKKKIKECEEEDKCRFHVPGKTQNHPDFSGRLGKTCSDVMSRTLADIPDGYPTDFTTKCKDGTSKIFVLVDQNNDLHYGRYDSNGRASHKPGGRKVTNLDSEGSWIYDGSLASWDYPPEYDGDSGLYYKFCSHMCVPRNREIQLLGGRRSSRSSRNSRNSRSSHSSRSHHSTKKRQS